MTLVYKTAIRENIRLSEAPSFAKPIMIMIHSSNGALDYKALAQEVIKQEKVISKEDMVLVYCKEEL